MKSYPQHPKLKHRIFIPKSSVKGHTDSDETPKYPLIIDIHGGGFALLNPSVDDKFNRPLCDENGFVVVSLDYYKSPQYPFPTALNILVETVLEILNDDSLPIDGEKVVLHGASAGASLALGMAQHEELQGQIKGLVLWYPPVDATFDRSRNFQRYVDDPKRYEHAGKALPLKAIEQLTALYLRKGTDLRDPRVSPRFCDASDLPRAILTVGCEFDGLCEEARIWMRELAGLKEEEDLGAVWDRDGKKWIMAEGEDHGEFLHYIFQVSPKQIVVIFIRDRKRLLTDGGIGFDHGLGKTDKLAREEKADVVRKQVVDWLRKEVFH